MTTHILEVAERMATALRIASGGCCRSTLSELRAQNGKSTPALRTCSCLVDAEAAAA